MESTVLRTLNMLRTARGRNHAVIDGSYECVSAVDAGSGQCVQ